MRGDVIFFIAVAVVTFPAAVTDVWVWVEDVVVEPHLVVVGVLTAHDGGPRGATKGVTDEGVLEAHALLYQLRGGLWHVCWVEVVFAHVVGKYEDYVGLWRRLGGGHGCLPPHKRHHASGCGSHPYDQHEH